MAADYPSDGAINDTSSGPPGEFLPLRALARWVIGLLVSTVILAAATVIAGPGPSVPNAWAGRTLGILSAIDTVVTSIAFLVWFRRARINADRFGWRQRRARGWIFWGWVVPIVNLWVPFQLMGDIWRAGLPPEQPRRTAWLPALWWATWLIGVPPLWIHSGRPSRHGSSTTAFIGLPLPHDWVSAISFGIAGLLLAAIVGTVSNGPVGSPAI